ncbi:MAG: tetratricopeptide repeat protein, partial [Verrucomicrobiota bacterium]|nr:tetratricopeptide repeat protein [Verrucomicrobiota bacterium]
FLQRSILDRRTPLPVPSTFLVNPRGELVAFYKGPVSVEQLLQDLPLSNPDTPPGSRRDASIPFPGRWIGKPVPGRPNRVASLMADHDEVELGASYLKHCASLLEAGTLDADDRRNLGDIYYVAGLLNGLKPEHRSEAITQLARARDLIPDDVRIRLELGRQYFLSGKLRNAEQEMSRAAEINPGDLALLMDLGLMRFRLGDFEKSHDAYSKVVGATPRNGLVRYHLANNEVRLGRLPDAIENYRKAIARIPDLSQAANNLAWILASHPDEELRSPEEALEITSRLCQQTREKSPLYLDTHSIALANLGRFQEAIVAANKAITLIPPRNKPGIEGIRQRISLYQMGKPYREAGW